MFSFKEVIKEKFHVRSFKDKRKFVNWISILYTNIEDGEHYCLGIEYTGALPNIPRQLENDLFFKMKRNHTFNI